MRKTKNKTREAATKRTEADILAEIFKLSWELEDRHARNRIQQAVQDVRDRRNGKDW